MGLKPMDAKCSACGAEFRSEPKRSFLGFQKLKCPTCQADVAYPLTRGYRISYWVIAVWMLIGLLGILPGGNILVTALLEVGAIVALVRDRQLHREVAAVASRKPVA